MTVLDGCDCYRCTQDRSMSAGEATMFGQRIAMIRMFLCQTCENKRCPHAADHRFACTNSNEVGQRGSLYESAMTSPLPTDGDEK